MPATPVCLPSKRMADVRAITPSRVGWMPLSCPMVSSSNASRSRSCLPGSSKGRTAISGRGSVEVRAETIATAAIASAAPIAAPIRSQGARRGAGGGEAAGGKGESEPTLSTGATKR